MQRGVGKEMERRVTTCFSAMQIVRAFHGSDQPQSGSSSDPYHRSKISAHLWPPVPVLIYSPLLDPLLAAAEVELHKKLSEMIVIDHPKKT